MDSKLSMTVSYSYIVPPDSLCAVCNFGHTTSKQLASYNPVLMLFIECASVISKCESLNCDSYIPCYRS